MKWNELLSTKRQGNYKKKVQTQNTDLRSEFEKDYHRIIGSASFRRLQDKTQVFPLDKSDFIRTRLTHSMEVSSFAKSLGHNIGSYILQNQLDSDFTLETKGDICDILQCAGLIHDIGNPPFGHFGEEAIREWFKIHLSSLNYKGQPLDSYLDTQMLQDLYHFEGNAQALRLVSKLHFLVNENGMNLNFGLLNTIIKYPVSSIEMDPKNPNIKYKKMGYFLAEEELYHNIAASTGAIGLRHPLTYILEAADDIAYRTADIEDAFKKGRISYGSLIMELEKFEKTNGNLEKLNPVEMLRHQYQNAIDRGIANPELYAIQNGVVRLQSAAIFCATEGFASNYTQIMDGTYEHDLFYNTSAQWVMKALGDIAYRYVFISQPILKLEVAAGNVIDFLLERFVPAAISYDTDVPMGMMEQKMIPLISENYRQTYHFYADGQSEQMRLYLRLLLVTDFISGMTDSYAKDLYQELKGID